MKFGIRPTEGGPHFDESLEQVLLAEKLGYDSIWLGEHQGFENYWPSPQLALAAFAARTTRITLGTNILVLTLANPVRLAGEFALLDHISHGRVVLGVGIGWGEAEFNNMQVPIAHRGGRLREYIILIRKLWTEKNVTFEGKFWSVKDFTLSPSPYQSPYPPIWIGGRSQENIKRAAEIGEAWFPDAAAHIEELKEGRLQYDAFLQQFGRPLDGIERPTTRHIIMAPTHDEAWAKAEKYLLGTYKLHLQRGNPMVSAAYSDNFNTFVSGRYIVGDTTECIAWIQRLRDEVGINHLLLKFSARDTPADAYSQMEQFASLVMPHFK